MFKLESKFKPFGDQPKAIEEIVNNFKNGKNEQILLGATGTGKTFTICNVIERVGRPTLVLAHNKTLAGQLYNEIKSFFHENGMFYLENGLVKFNYTGTYIQNGIKYNIVNGVVKGKENVLTVMRMPNSVLTNSIKMVI